MAFALNQSRIAGEQHNTVHRQLAAHQMHIALALGVQRQLRGLVAMEQTRIQTGIGMDRHRTLGAIIRGHQAQAADLRHAGLYLGAEWREDRAGTSAVGACLATGEALVVHQSDHFDFTHTQLSCTAAPIYDLRGELAAVLDLSLLKSPAERASQNLALNLVVAAARRVELANLMAQSRNDWVLRFSQSPDFLDVDPDAAISIDARGRIRATTHAGARALVAAGKGAERGRFNDINQGRQLSVSTTAADYLSYFDPASEAEMSVTAPRIPPSTPVLSVVGDADPLFAQVRAYYVDKLPAHPHSRLLEVKATHLSTPEVAYPDVVAWIKQVTAN